MYPTARCIQPLLFQVIAESAILQVQSLFPMASAATQSASTQHNAQ